jgi:transcriptional regulator with XRE-family HTH domain
MQEGMRYPGISPTMVTTNNRSELGRFVRAHRERLRPLRTSERRRTPGLRREELAERAGISATWCAWIEQGRDVQASPHTLERLADALELSAAERAYLFELAGRRDPESTTTDLNDPPQSLTAMIDCLSQPAYALDRLWNACAWNVAAAELFEGWLQQGGGRNLLRYVFLSPAARQLIPDWEERATHLLAEFRCDYGRYRDDTQLRALTEALCQASPLFAQGWAAQSVSYRAGGVRTFAHSLRGRLQFQQHTFIPADRLDCKLVLLTPLG